MSLPADRGPGTPPPYAVRRGPRLRWLAFLIVAWPLLEIVTYVMVSRAIGLGWTLILVIAKTFLGVWLIKREGPKAWRDLRQAAQAGLTPTREIADAALVYIGGILLILPGLLGGVIGLFLSSPMTRSTARRSLGLLVPRAPWSSIIVWAPGARGYGGRARGFDGPVGGFGGSAHRAGPTDFRVGTETSGTTCMRDGEAPGRDRQDPGARDPGPRDPGPRDQGIVRGEVID